MENIGLLEKLSNAFGPGGFEEEVILAMREEILEFSPEVDAMNNVYLKLPGNTGHRPVVMLDAHLDEVGFMVQSINDKGLLSLATLGGWVPSNVPAHAMVIKNAQGEKIKGVVVSKPPHFMSPEEKAKGGVDLLSLQIDVGATSREEVVDLFRIQPGDPVVPDVTFYEEKRNGVLRGKAFDNRIGCYALIQVMKQLKSMDLPVDVIGALAAQEEIGTRGAQVTTQMVSPDVAIVFEGSPADDAYLPPYEAQGVLKKGVQIRHLDQSYISHRGFIDVALQIAKEAHLPYQRAVRRGGGTNAGKIHLQGKAVPVLVLGIPSRYVHTHYSYAAKEDVEATISLAVKTIASLNKEVMATLLKKDLFIK